MENDAPPGGLTSRLELRSRSDHAGRSRIDRPYLVFFKDTIASAVPDTGDIPLRLAEQSPEEYPSDSSGPSVLMIIWVPLKSKGLIPDESVTPNWSVSRPKRGIGSHSVDVPYNHDF